MEKKFREMEQLSALFESAPSPMSLVDFAEHTIKLLPDCVLGGDILMSMYAEPRLTLDLDLLILHNDKLSKETLLKNGYLETDFLDYSKPSRKIIKLSNGGREVDLIYYNDPVVEKFLFSTTQKKNVFGATVNILGITGFLLTKIISWRTKDRADIEAIIDANENIDLKDLKEITMHLKIFDRMSIFEKVVK